MPDIPQSERPALAAVLFDPGQPVDAVLRAALAAFDGHRVLGWLQGQDDSGDCDCQDIVLTAIQGGARRAITQDLGRGARGCRLDGGALAEIAGWLAADLAQGPDLLVLNRFGKSEAEGGGLSGVLEQALAQDVPVLVPVNRRQLVFWQDYSGGLALDLPCEAQPITDWLASVLPSRDTARKDPARKDLAAQDRAVGAGRASSAA